MRKRWKGFNRRYRALLHASSWDLMMYFTEKKTREKTLGVAVAETNETSFLFSEGELEKTARGGKEEEEKTNEVSFVFATTTPYVFFLVFFSVKYLILFPLKYSSAICKARIQSKQGRPNALHSLFACLLPSRPLPLPVGAGSDW